MPKTIRAGRASLTQTARCPHCDQLAGRTSHTVASGPNWHAYHGDAQSVLATLPDQSIDAIVTAPPYAAGATSLLGRLQSSSKKYRNTGAKPLPNIAGDSMLPEAWAAMMRGILGECYRLARPGAHTLLFCDWRSLPALLGIVGSIGFGLRGCLVWDKGRGARPQKNGFRSQSELILWAKKGGEINRKSEIVPAPDVYLDGVFRHATMSGNTKQHLTQKPLALMAELLRIVPAGSSVLDPFHGSGTTGLAALEQGHTYIGIESVPAYHAIAVERLTALT